MEKTIRLLAVLLGVQLVLAAGLAVFRSDLSAPKDDVPLLAFKKDRVDRLTLEGPEKAKLVLTKVDDRWRLPDTENFPADREKIEKLLERLADLKQGLPVATTAAAQERFKVNDASFERRITLAEGDRSLAKLYLGTSPSLRRTHARAGDATQIQSVQLAAYEVPTKAEDWEDKTVLQIPRAQIASIEVGDLRLQREATPPTNGDTPAAEKNDGGDEKSGAGAHKTDRKVEPAQVVWHVAGAEAGNDVDKDAAEKLAGQLDELRFDKVLGRDEKPEYGLKQPALALAVTRTGGERIEYRVGKAPDKAEYVIKVSTRPEYFRLPSYVATGLIEAADTKKLLHAAAAADAKQAAKTPSK